MLPICVRQKLIQASQINSSLPRGDCIERNKAINAIVDEAKRKHPKLFVPDALPCEVKVSRKERAKKQQQHYG